MSEKYELDSITKGLIKRMPLAELLSAKYTFGKRILETGQASAYYDEICTEVNKRKSEEK